MTDWKKIVGRYGHIVWTRAYRLLGNQQDAADCFQETFLSALEVSQRGRIRNWPSLLNMLATRRSLDLLRKRIRQNTRSEDLANWSMVPATNPDPSSQAETMELQASLRKAMTELPPRQAEVLCLRYLDQLSDRQIARQLGIEQNAVRVILHRARSRLRELLSSSARGRLKF